MEIVVDVSRDVRAALDSQLPGVSDRMRAALEKVGKSAQTKLRAQVDAAGLGMGLNKAWQLGVYPPPHLKSLHPAALVYSKSVILHEAFAAGAVVLPRRSKYLVVPLQRAIDLGFGATTVSRKGGTIPGGQKRKVSRLDDAAEALRADIVSVMPGRKGGGQRKGGTPRAQIRLLPSKGRPGSLVAVLFQPGAKRGEPLFLLLRTAKVPKLLDLKSVRDAVEGELRAAVTEALGSAA